MTDGNLPALPPWMANPAQPVRYQGESWESLTANADEVFGGDLEKAQSLIGVPHMIVLATFRIGDYQRPDMDIPGDYVSLDVITAPQAEIDRARARMRGRGDDVPESLVTGGEHLVWNASGTGAYRQVVLYLEIARKLIRLPDGPEGGEFGVSRLDTPVRQWGIHDSVPVKFDASGQYESVEFNVRLHAPRGLRKSMYDNKRGKDIETFYLA
jgi:hypothetical protein